MDEKTRTKKDIDKLEKIISIFKSYGFDSKYPSVFEYVTNYASDARHYFDKGDYFTSFGSANYAYGFVDAILVIEGKKDEHVL